MHLYNSKHFPFTMALTAISIAILALLTVNTLAEESSIFDGAQVDHVASDFAGGYVPDP